MQTIYGICSAIVVLVSFGLAIDMKLSLRKFFAILFGLAALGWLLGIDFRIDFDNIPG